MTIGGAFSAIAAREIAGATSSYEDAESIVGSDFIGVSSPLFFFFYYDDDTIDVSSEVNFDVTVEISF